VALPWVPDNLAHLVLQPGERAAFSDLSERVPRRVGSVYDLRRKRLVRNPRKSVTVPKFQPASSTKLEAQAKKADATMTTLTPAVVQRIEALFQAESREAAGRMIAELCGANLPLSTHMGPDPSGFDRIRLAVLKLSQGDLERLRRQIDGANIDWRDTLMAAGFGEDVRAHLQWNP
jgi:hypothetical protein